MKVDIKKMEEMGLLDHKIYRPPEMTYMDVWKSKISDFHPANHITSWLHGFYGLGTYNIVPIRKRMLLLTGPAALLCTVLLAGMNPSASQMDVSIAAAETTSENTVEVNVIKMRAADMENILTDAGNDLNADIFIEDDGIYNKSDTDILIVDKDENLSESKTETFMADVSVDDNHIDETVWEDLFYQEPEEIIGEEPVYEDDISSSETSLSESIGEEVLEDNTLDNLFHDDSEEVLEEITEDELFHDASEEQLQQEAELWGDLFSEEDDLFYDEPEEEMSWDDLFVSEPEENKSTTLVMTNTVLNVRADASIDSERVGLLYENCGGTILEKKDGWTKLQSGDLIGWANDEYLLFDEEAETAAEESGSWIVTSEAASLRVRTQPSAESDIMGLIFEDEVVEAAGDPDDGWIEVVFEEKTGYVSTDYVNVEFQIDTGETIEEIKKREEEQKTAEKILVTTAEVPEQTEEMIAVANVDEPLQEIEVISEASSNDLTLLAAIIYCEAGNQSHEGKIAVGAVVLNRVNSSAFPNTIESVIRDPGQFSPVKSGKFDRTLNSGNIPESCYQAAQDVLSGANTIGNALFFRNPKKAGAHSGITIGDHVFW